MSKLEWLKSILGKRLPDEIEAIAEEFDRFENLRIEQDSRIAELEQRLTEANARIAELKIKEFMYDEHSDAVKKCLALNKQLVATEKALQWVCDVYIVGHYYSDDQRKEQLERTVRRVMVKANGGEEE